MVKGEVKPEEPISLVLWADEKHTSREIARQLGIATGYEQFKVVSLIEELEREVSSASLWAKEGADPA